MGRRALRFSVRPANIFYALLGLLLVARHYRISGRFSYYQFWLFAWSNSILKYQDITQDDFDLESVSADFDIRDVMPVDYEKSANEPIPANKTNAQLRATGQQLRALIKRASLIDARSGQGKA